MDTKELKSFLKGLKRLNDKGRESRIKLAKEDFKFFVATYLGHHINICALNPAAHPCGVGDTAHPSGVGDTARPLQKEGGVSGRGREKDESIESNDSSHKPTRLPTNNNICALNPAAHPNEIFKETSVFRNFVYKELNDICEGNEKHVNKVIIKAYRGAAKSTLISRLFVLWQLCKGNKRYVVLISSKIDLAKEAIELLKSELEDNVNLISDFKIKPYNVWTSEDLTFSIDERLVKIKAFSVGKKIRGTNFLSMRPDLIICDDIENDENIESKLQREKIYKWFNKAILKLPSRLNPFYNVILVGTTLHYDSLLQRLSARSDFNVYEYPLLRKMPNNIESLSKENFKDFKFKGYILDDSNIDIKEVMRDFLEDKNSFYSEYQNVPLDKENAPLSNYTTYITLPREIDLCVIGVDPSLGKKRGDYFALCQLFYSKTHNKLYASAKGFKIAPDKMIDKILKLFFDTQKITQNVTIACEEVAFQEYFKNELKKRFMGLGIFCGIVGVKNTQNKEVRLDALAPLLNAGDLVVCESDFLLQEELDSYPKGAHDDLIDSIDIAKRVINTYSQINYKEALRIQKEYANRFRALRYV